MAVSWRSGRSEIDDSWRGPSFELSVGSCGCRAVALLGRPPKGCAPSKRRSKQVVNLLPGVAGGHAFPELDLDQPHEQRVQRSPGGKELLGDLGEGPPSGDHRGKCGNLAACSLGVSGGGGGVAAQDRPTHGRTKTAPVMPAAA